MYLLHDLQALRAALFPPPLLLDWGQTARYHDSLLLPKEQLLMPDRKGRGSLRSMLQSVDLAAA